MITPEMVTSPGEVFITNAVIYPNFTIEAYELRCAVWHVGYDSLRFQYENIVTGGSEIMTSEEFGNYCSGGMTAIGVAVYGIPKS